MAAIRIDRFFGLAPRFNPRDIPVEAAQHAVNIRYDGGDMQPFQKPATPDDSSLASIGDLFNLPDVGNLFWYRFGSDARFIAFGDAMHVTGGVRPIPNDVFRRWYWNVSGGEGEQGLFTISLTNSETPTPNGLSTGSGKEYREFAGYRAGIPAPALPPEAEATEAELGRVGSGTGNAITSLSRTNPTTVNLTSAPPFEDGQVVRLSVDPDYPRPADDEPDPGPPPEDPEEGGEEVEPDGQVWSLDGLEAVVQNVDATSFDLGGIGTAGFQEFTESDLGALTISQYLRDQDKETRAYVFTYVSQFDEEGARSAASNVVETQLNTGVVEIDIGDAVFDLAERGGTLEFVDRIRVYRALSPSAGSAEFFYVGELNFNGGEPTDGLSWVDTPSASTPAQAWTGRIRDAVPTGQLGRPIATARWYPPPNNLKGVAWLAIGIMAGWEGNTMHFSEFNAPYAWDPDNTISFDDEIIGAESFGNVLVVGTRGRPHIVTGSDPRSMRRSKLPKHAPLLGPRAIVDAGSGVIYAADNGLVWVGAGGSEIITRKWSKEEWLQAAGSRDRLSYFDGKVFFYGEGEPPLVFSLVDGQAEASYLSTVFLAATRKDNSLAIARPDFDFTGSPHRLIRYFNEERDAGGSVRMTGIFKSGIATFHRPVNVGVAQVLADGYPITLSVQAIRPDGYAEPVVGQPTTPDSFRSYTVRGPEPIRLEGGYLSRDYVVEIFSDHRVQRIVLATSMDDLRAQA